MQFTDIIVIAIIGLIIGGAIVYIVKAKKKGKKCIGCPYAGSCSTRSCEGTNSESSVD